MRSRGRVPGGCWPAALKAEAGVYVDALVDQVDEDGRRLVVRNGHHEPRPVSTAAGAIEVRAPRVNDKCVDEASGEREWFCSAILSAWCCLSLIHI